MFILFYSLFLTYAQIEGRWIPGSGNGLLEIKKVNDEYTATILDGKPNNTTNGYDIYNPDKKLKGRKLKGVTILTGLKKKSETEFVDGRIYDPNSGNTYMSKAEVISKDQIKFRGYMLVPLFGRTDIWTRAPEDFKGWTKPEEVLAPKEEAKPLK